MFLCQLSSTGEVDVTVNMEAILSKHNGPKDINSLVGKYLYIAVLLQEDTGTDTTTCRTPTQRQTLIQLTTQRLRFAFTPALFGPNQIFRCERFLGPRSERMDQN